MDNMYLNTITIEDGYGHQWLESSIVEQVSGATFDISFTLTESSELQAILGYQNLLSTASLSNNCFQIPNTIRDTKMMCRCPEILYMENYQYIKK